MIDCSRGHLLQQQTVQKERRFKGPWPSSAPSSIEPRDLWVAKTSSAAKLLASHGSVRGDVMDRVAQGDRTIRATVEADGGGQSGVRRRALGLPHRVAGAMCHFGDSL